MNRALCVIALVASVAACNGESKDTHTGDTGPTTPGETDADLDGYSTETDCDDDNDAIHPGATEVCDGVDNDCDEVVDGPNAEDALTFYADADADGFGDADAPVFDCALPEGASEDATDCDDTQAAVNPAALETCDGQDEDCDDEVDEDPIDGDTWHADLDEDGYGSDVDTVLSCEQPDGWLADGGDCNDLTNAVYPGAPEYCDLTDNNCDGTIDEAPVNGDTFWLDGDGDGYGDADYPVVECALPKGYAAVDGDCDDVDPAISPAADELCDLVDNDCDAVVDEPEDAVDALVLYVDTDGDGYGDPATEVRSCDAISGTVELGGDCDETDISVNPGADEVCGDGVDNNCEGTVDGAEAIDALTFYADLDRDGFGDAAVPILACTRQALSVDVVGDCDDTDSDVYPGAEELLCTGRLEDCDAVSGDGDIWVPADAPDLDDALALASGGEIICLDPGTWTGPYTIDLPVTVASSADAAKTVLTAPPGDAIVTVTADDVVLSDLAISGGSGTVGGGLLADGVTGLHLDALLFDGNTADDGGAAALVDCVGVLIEGGTWTTNSATRGGALFVDGGDGVLISRAIFEANSATRGGAVFADGALGLASDRSDYLGNLASEHGGAWFVQGNAGEAVDLDDGSFVGNIADIDGGAFYGLDIVLSSVKPSFESNEGTLGGAVFLSGGTGHVLRTSDFLGNGRAGGFGGAIYLVSAPDTDLAANLFDNNQAEQGGAVYVEESAEFNVSRSTFSANSATTGGGMVIETCAGARSEDNAWMSNTADVGGGVYLHDSTRVVLSQDSVDLNVAAAAGGGVYCAGSELRGVDVVFGANTPENLVCDDCDEGCDTLLGL